MIECLEIALECDRSDFALHAGINGIMAGPIVISEPTRDKRIRVIDCLNDTNEFGYSIHPDSEKITLISTTAKFVIAIESGGAYRRLLESSVQKRFNCILVDLEGQPSRATKRIVKRLSTEMKLPVAAFLDSDPWSIRILLSLMSGSTKTAHLSKDFATPDVHWLGIMPTDITDYTLPTDKLKPTDKLALEELLKDPRLQARADILSQIEYQIKIGMKCEQQSLAKYGVDFAANTYLPFKLLKAGLISKEVFDREYTPSPHSPNL
jgi:DNA topoisomerase-6 subunit A